MKLRQLNKYFINLLCVLLWIVPMYFFARDFFDVDAIYKVSHKESLDILAFSVKQAFFSTVIALVISLIPAYYVTYEDNIITKFINGLVFIPFFFPVISVVTIFSIVFNLEFFRQFNILYTLKAIIIANVFYNTPLFVKYISEGLKKIPKEISEAMRVDGASGMTIFFKGQFPLIFPQVFRGFILIFTYCFLGFGIILSLGGIKFSTIEIEIVNSIMSNGDYSKAMYLGSLQIFVLLVLNFIAGFFNEYELSGDREYKKINIFFKIYSLIYMIIQYGVIIFSFLYSFVNIFTGEVSLKIYKKIFSTAFLDEYPIIQSLINSIEVSIVVSSIAVLLIYIVIKNYNRFTDILIFSNLGISSAFLAITLYYLNVLFDIPLIVLLIIGYLVTVIPIGYSFMYQYVKKFPIEIEESASLDCKNSIQKFIYVEFPILKNIFLSAFLQIFSVVFGEFTIGYTMQLEDSFPLASLVNYSMVSNKKYMESSAFTSVIIIIILTTFILGEYIKEKE